MIHSIPGRAAILMLALTPVMAGAEVASSLAPRVRLETSEGAFVLELDTERAPLSTENFLRYVREGYYDGTVFHRVIPNFVVQGGGYDADLAERKAHPPIPNESGNGLSNRRGTVGLAREDNPHSGSSQFYINLMDNAALDPLPSRWGYAVFGKVIEGMDVVDRIAHLPTRTVEHFGPDVPVARPAIKRAWVIEREPAPAPSAEALPPPGTGMPE